MPLFGSKEKTQPPPPVETKRNSNSLFRRRSTSPKSAPTATSTHSRNPFKRDDDPSILAAKKRVQAAEDSERAADKALNDTRHSVRQAREELRRLEKEAGEE
jgi:hypothetical protein